MKSKIVFSNRGSGRAGQLETVKRHFESTSTTWVELTRDVDILSEIELAITNGCETVVAAGGDGTVNAIVNAMMVIDEENRPSLGIIPMGTANDFAGTLAIPSNPITAIGLLDHPPTPIDTVRIRGENFERYFANVAAGGNSVRVSEEMTDEVKARWGALSYLRGAFNVLPHMQTYNINVVCDSEHIRNLDAWAVLVCNGKTNAGHIQVAPFASPTDGLLDLVLIRNGYAADMFEIAASNLLGNYLECDQVIFRQVRKLTLSSKPSMRFSVDGEVIAEEPVEFEIQPEAINMHTGL